MFHEIKKVHEKKRIMLRLNLILFPLAAASNSSLPSAMIYDVHTLIKLHFQFT